MAMSNFDPKTGHEKLIKISMGLNYESNERGVCYGFACMGLQAFFVNDLNSFKARIDQIKSLPMLLFIDLPNLVKNAREEALKITREKYDISDINDVGKNKLSSSQKVAFSNDLNTALIEQLSFFINKKFNISLTFPETKTLLSTVPFLEGIELNQQPHTRNYAPWFDRPITRQDIVRSMPLTQSLPLETLEGITVVDRFINCYSETDVILMLETFIIELKSKHPVGFLCVNMNHAISLGYDPENQQWTLINLKDLTVLESSSIKEIAHEIISAFENLEPIASPEVTKTEDREAAVNPAHETSKVASLSMTVVCCGKHLNEVKPQMNNWKASSVWQKIHSIKEKSKTELDKIDSNHQSQLLMAAKCDDYPMLQGLINNHANINQTNNEGYTALHYAVRVGKKNTVQLLLKNDCNINVLDKDKVSPLQDAIEQKEYEKVKLLLIYGANPSLFDRKILIDFNGHGTNKILKILKNAEIIYPQIQTLTQMQPMIHNRLVCIRKLCETCLKIDSVVLMNIQFNNFYQLDMLAAKELNLQTRAQIYADFFHLSQDMILSFLSSLKTKYNSSLTINSLFCQEKPNERSSVIEDTQLPLKKQKRDQ